ncbi:MAG: hypothetical protein IPH59_02255 [bacterium]|nr:hypothetical protein [bacterium]
MSGPDPLFAPAPRGILPERKELVEVFGFSSDLSCAFSEKRSPITPIDNRHPTEPNTSFALDILFQLLLYLQRELPGRTEMPIIEYKPKLFDLVHAKRTCGKGAAGEVRVYIIGILILLFAPNLIYTGYLLLGVLMVLIGMADVFNVLPEHLLAPVLEWNRNPKFKEQHRLTLTTEEPTSPYRRYRLDS